jgi:hypothetical protein
MKSGSGNHRDLETLYKKELEQFENALHVSEGLLHAANTMSIEEISEKVAERESIIETLKSIESDVRQLNTDTKQTVSEQYNKQIAKRAKKLVEIDSKIYKILQEKKLKLVQKYSQTASDSSYSRQKAIAQEKSSKIVDIRQK